MVIMDATALLLLLNDKTSPPKHPETRQPIQDAHDRIVAAVTRVREKGDKILIAAPVLAELLVRAENAGSAYLQEFNESVHFKPVPFDQVAAIYHADYTRKAIEQGDKKDGIENSIHKIKFDRQIIAIAQAEGADTIYTDDDKLAKHAEKRGLKVIRTHEIILNLQPTLFDSDPDQEIQPDQAMRAESAENSNGVTVESMKKSEEAAVAAGEVLDTNTKGEAVVETAPPPLMP